MIQMKAKEMFENLGYKQENDTFNKGIHYHLIQLKLPYHKLHQL